jgi:uncharacterized protein
MRSDITFGAEGVSLRGWLYTPETRQPGGRYPLVVMAHGWGAVKEMYLDAFLEHLTDPGPIPSTTRPR